MILKELAVALNLELHGDPELSILGLGSIANAKHSELSFIVSARYSEALRASKAGVVIGPETLRSLAPGNYLVSADPYSSYAQASWLLSPEAPVEAGIHASALVHTTALVDPTASIGPGVIIGAHSVIEKSVNIGAHTVIGSQVHIGEHSQLFARVTLYDHVQLGQQCRIQSGAVIGSEGFGYAWAKNRWQPIHQTGGVIIGERVHVGANTTIDCGAIGPTVISDGVIMDNQIQIAHNVRIGENTAIAGCVGIAGSTTIGSHCQIGGACNIVGHISIADGVVVNAASLVARSITSSGRYGSGTPLQPQNLWRRSYVHLAKLDELVRRVRRLERSRPSK